MLFLDHIKIEICCRWEFISRKENYVVEKDRDREILRLSILRSKVLLGKIKIEKGYRKKVVWEIAVFVVENDRGY